MPRPHQRREHPVCPLGCWAKRPGAECPYLSSPRATPAGAAPWGCTALSLSLCPTPTAGTQGCGHVLWGSCRAARPHGGCRCLGRVCRGGAGIRRSPQHVPGLRTLPARRPAGHRARGINQPQHGLRALPARILPAAEHVARSKHRACQAGCCGDGHPWGPRAAKPGHREPSTAQTPCWALSWSCCGCRKRLGAQHPGRGTTNVHWDITNI